MKKVVGVVWGLLPVSVFAECVPVPDCASIGYTETSCEGDSLKCPFDTTKLYCPPCDSSYKYSCSGDNIKNPIGDTCNNKYAACECIAGATFSNGECICNTSCDTVGNIYYSDGTCNSCNITDKTPVGIIAYKDENRHFVVSLETNISMTWSADQKDAEGNINIIQNLDIAGLTNFGSKESALQDYNGFENTRMIVDTYGENATGVAAVYCYNYAPAGLESSKGQWYLPATGELFNTIYTNKNNINIGLKILNKNALSTEHHWASSEGTFYSSWIVKSSANYVFYRNKSHPSPVTCILAI